MPVGRVPTSASMKSPRWIRCVVSPYALFSGHSSRAIRWSSAVRISKPSLGELTALMASPMPHLLNWAIDEGRSPIPAPTSRISEACS